MKSTHPRPRGEFRNSRTFSAALLSLFTFVAPLSPLFTAAAQTRGVARPGAGERATSEQPAAKTAGGAELKAPALDSAPPVAPATVSLTATKDDGFVAGAGPRPGGTITYTVKIKNSGSTDATNVQFLDNLGANLTLVPGSVKSQPVARNDSYQVLGNVKIDVPAASGLLANDFDPDPSTTLSISSAPTTSARGGNVTVNTTTGAFTYDPPAGYDGPDSFKYTVSDGTLTDEATVSLTVAGMIWFVNNAASACTDRALGCGRLSQPFSTLEAFEAINGGAAKSNDNTDTVDPEAGDNIFIYTGSTAYNGPLTLEDTQKLIGQGATDTLQAISGVTVPTHSAALPGTLQDNAGNQPPTIISAGNGVVLAQSNVLRGFNVGDVATGGTKISGAGFGQLTVGKTSEPDVALSGVGRALSLSNGTLEPTSGFNSAISSGSSGAAAFLLSQITAGAITFESTTVLNAAAGGVEVNGSSANINFGETTVNTGGTFGVALANNPAGTRTFVTLSITGGSQIGFRHYDPDIPGAPVGGGAVTVTGQTTITNPGGNGIDIQNSNDNLTFAATTVNKNNAGTGVNIVNNSSRTVTFASLSVTTANGPGLNATGGGNVNVTTGTGSQITATSVSGSNAPALNADGVTLGANFTSLQANGSGTGTFTGVNLNSVSGALTVGSTTVGNVGGVGINVTGSGATLNFGNAAVTATGDTGVSLAGNGGAITFADLDIQPDGGETALSTNGGAGLITASSGTIETSAAAALLLNGSNLNLALTSVTAANGASTAAGVSLTGCSGAVSISGGTLTGGTTLAPFVVSGGTVAVSYGGGITQANNARLVDVSNNHDNTATPGSGTLTFSGTLQATAGTGLLFDNANGVYQFNGTTTLNGGDAGIDILNGSAGAFTFGTGTAITNPSGPAFSISGATPTNAAVTYSGSISKNTSGFAIDIDNHDANTVTFQTGTISATGSASGIQVQNSNGGTINFDNPTKTFNTGANPAVALNTSNAGAAFNFGNGGLDIDTTGSVGFSAIGGGTVTVGTGANPNTIDSVSATALNISNTNIGSGNVTFRSISSGNSTAAADPANGIVLNNTGTAAGNGGLIVTGTSTTDGTGGTIQNISGRGASFISAKSISLSNMTFTNVGTTNGADPTNAASTCGDISPGGNSNTGCNAGIHADGVNGLALANVDMNGGAQQGINGNSVTNFTLSNSNVLNFGNEVRESGVKINNLFGTSSITNSTISGNEERQIDVQNDTGTLTNFTVSNTTISTSAAPNGAQGILFSGSGTASMELTVTSSTFTGLRSTCIQTDVQGGSPSMEVSVTGSSFQNSLAAGVDIIQAFSGNVKYNVSNNPTFLNLGSHVININQQTTSTAGTLLQGKIEGNTIGDAASGNSVHTEAVCGACDGIRIRSLGEGGTIANVINNTVRGVTGWGISASLLESSSPNNNLQTTITGNTVVLTARNTANTAFINDDGIRVISGSLTNDNGVACADIANNTSSSSGPAGDGIQVTQRQLTTVRLPGYTGGQYDSNAVITYLTNRNPLTVDTKAASTLGTGGGFQNTSPANSPCASPALPSAPDNDDNLVIQPGGAAQSATAPAAAAPLAPQPHVIPYQQALLPYPVAAEPAAPAGGRTDVPPAQPVAAPVAKTAADRSSAKEGGPQSAGRTEKSAQTKSVGAVVVRPQADTVTVNIPTLPGNGDEVTITFQATVAESPTAPTVSNQGSVSATGITTFMTDDPETNPAPAANTSGDATVTTINRYEPSINVTSSKTPTEQGESVTFTATVGRGNAPAGGDAPTGAVKFVDTQGDSDPTNDEVFCPSVQLTNGTATCETTAVDSGGPRTIAAIYSGDGRFDPATATVTQTVTVCTASPVVTSTADSGAGTLREAITNACVGATITFNIDLPNVAGPHVINVANPLVIARSVTITGPLDESVTIDTTGNVRAFEVTGGTSVNLNHLTVSGASTSGQSGAGLFVNSAGVTVTVANSTFSGNTVINGAGGAMAVIAGTLNVRNTTVSGNTATFGGGFYNSGGTLSLLHVTATNNNANGDAGSGPSASGAVGGGIYTAAGSTTNATNSIVAGNTAGDATAASPNTEGPLVSASNLIDVNAKLGALASNGGPTQTHRPNPDSPALDAGNSAAADGAGLTTDQRGTGFTRKADSLADADEDKEVDIGAYEVRAGVEDIGDKNTQQNTALGPFNFKVADGDLVTVTAESSNDTVVPDSNVVVGGTGGTRTLTITPATGQTGQTTITVTVRAGSGATAETVTDTFVLNVTSKTPSTVAITSHSPDPSNIGEAVTVAFTVTGTGGGEPTGSVTITVNNADPSETCTGTLASGTDATDSIAEGTCQITLTKAGSRTLTATYNGDATYAGDTETATHAVRANVSISDASAHESAGEMTFTVRLSAPALSPVTVNFATADGGANPATEVSDYTPTNGTVTFAAGQVLQTVAVPINPDADDAETDETFLVNLTQTASANPTDAQAVGTITVANPAAAIMISEIRTSGPDPDGADPMKTGAENDFIELYNNSDSPYTFPADWGIFQSGSGADSTCGADPVLIATIAAGRVIPPRGHYLITGKDYDLPAVKDQEFNAGKSLLADRNVGLFRTTDVAQLSSATREDAVGMGINLDGNCDLLREGTPLAATQDSASEHSFFRRLNSGRPADTNASTADFLLVSTTPDSNVGSNPAPVTLGAPGPENTSSPIQLNDQIKASPIDPMVSAAASPNQVRDTGATGANAQHGTLELRRRWTNKTGQEVSVLRFRLVELTTKPAPACSGPCDGVGDTADLRALTSVDTTVTLTDGVTQVPLKGTSVGGPTQSMGGGYNSTLVVTTLTPLAPNASVEVRFVLGVEQRGFFRFFVNAEAGPPPTTALPAGGRAPAPQKKAGAGKSGQGGQ